MDFPEKAAIMLCFFVFQRFNMPLNIRKGYDKELLRQFDISNNVANVKMSLYIYLGLTIINIPLLVLDIYRYFYERALYDRYGYNQILWVHLASCLIFPFFWIYGVIKSRDKKLSHDSPFYRYYWRMFFFMAYLYVLFTSAPCLAIYENLTTLFVATLALAVAFKVRHYEYMLQTLWLCVLDLISIKLYVPEIEGVYVGIVSDIVSTVVLAICINYVVYRDAFTSFINKTNFEKEQAAKIVEREANKAKTEFLANMSHEIRTPINGIHGMLSMLQESGLNEDQSDYVKYAKSSCELLNNIVNDLFDMVLIKSNKIKLENRPYSPAELLSTTLANFAPQMKMKGIETKISIDETLPEFVTGDKNRVVQILNNLLSNAWKFTPAGTISTECRRTLSNGHESISFSVKDTGIGIPDDKMPLIFDRFFQLDSSPRKQYSGAGLGLAICKSLSEMMGGTISARSNSPEAGTTFTFELPLLLPDEDWNKSVKEYKEIPEKFLVGKNILCVEDNETNLKFVTALLVKRGAYVTTAPNGRVALDIMEKNDFDIVLLDIRMPVMDGIETIQHIRADEAENKGYTPVIAGTTYTMKKNREEIMENGFDGYLSKPFSEADLMIEIYNNINKKRSSE